MSARFYVENIATDQALRISGSEARHISRVMRLGPGDRITLFDGQNRECTAEIDAVQKNDVLLTAGPLRQVSREASLPVSLGVALPKGDRLKFMVEKLTEIGVSELIPVTFARSSVLPRPNTIEKMRRYVIESSKQCGRNRLLRVGEPQQAVEFFSASAAARQWQMICVPGAPETVARAILDRLPARDPGQPVSFCVGPEGGFTDEELALARQAHWHPVHLGARILRTETAAITSCHTALALADES